MDDLFPDNKRYTGKGGKKHVGRTETVYQYHDENGKLLFETIRKEPKDFRQRRPNPEFNHTQPTSRENPEYIYNLQDTRRVLFRLPQLLSALQKTPDKAVFVVEGEKDVLTAHTLGIVATTNPMGAGKWLPEYANFLRGANVVVIPDNDEPGKAHARAVCESLKGVARTVRLVELPGLSPKQDLSDWVKLHKGGPDQVKAELRKLVRNTKLYGTDNTTTPAIVPEGTKAEPKPEPKEEPAPMPATDAKGTNAESFPDSPTIRNEAGLPNPPAGIVPGWPDGETKKAEPAAPVPVVEEPKPVPLEAPKPAAESKPSPIPSERAARVAQWFKDAKATAAALKLAGATVESPMAFYGAMRQAIAMLDQTFTLANGAPKLDKEAAGQISLLMGAYLIQAAADFGLGCGVLAEEAKEPVK